MKKILLAMMLMLLSVSSRAATAAVIFTDIESIDTNNVMVDFQTIYVGSDVQNGFFLILMQIPVAKNSLSTIMTSIASKVRSYATANGFTVPANQVFLPSYSGL